MNSVAGVSLSQGALVVDPFELALVLSLTSQVLEKTGGFLPPRTNPKEIDDLIGRHFNQILVDIRDIYRDEPPEKFVSVCWRMFSLYRLIANGDLAEWMPDDQSSDLNNIPHILIYVAATCPLVDKKGFDPLVFKQSVQACIASELA